MQDAGSRFAIRHSPFSILYSPLFIHHSCYQRQIYFFSQGAGPHRDHCPGVGGALDGADRLVGVLGNGDNDGKNAVGLVGMFYILPELFPRCAVAEVPDRAQLVGAGGADLELNFLARIGMLRIGGDVYVGGPNAFLGADPEGWADRADDGLLNRPKAVFRDDADAEAGVIADGVVRCSVPDELADFARSCGLGDGGGRIIGLRGRLPLTVAV